MTTTLQAEIQISPEVREQAVSFTVNGETLRGILCLPAAGKSRAGLIFAHGWSGNRHGPAGMLCTLARCFAAGGVASLRFDFRGRGESGGDGLNATLTTMADDLVAATTFFCEQTQVARPWYLGLCSGGNVTIGTLKRLPQAQGLILLSVYPFSDGDAFGRDVHRTLHYLKVYWHKACRAETWRRLFQGDVHLKQVANVLFGHLFKRGANKRKEGESAKDANGAASKDAGDAAAASGASRVKGQVAKAAASESRLQGKEAPKTHLTKLRADLPGLMFYGTADPDAPAAMTYFGDYIRENKLPMRIEVLEGANHNFSAQAWLDSIARQSLEFMKG
ncbi:MAG: alpha/beta hydrolase [Lentisphaeria bacterium]|jgi:pimeloyl-ACP methyl ester carboxylesterase